MAYGHRRSLLSTLELQGVHVVQRCGKLLIDILRGERGLPFLAKPRRRPPDGFRTMYVPGRRLSWSTVVDGDETGSSAFHGWVITPTENGCHVLTEETQQGPFFLEEVGRRHPGALYRYHQEWVDCLARSAEKEATNAKAGAEAAG